MTKQPAECSETQNVDFQLKFKLLSFCLAVFIGYAVVKLMDRFGIWGLPLVLAIILLLVLILLGLTPWLQRRHYLFHPLYIVLVTFGIGYLFRSFYIVLGHYEVMVGFNAVDGSRYLWRALALATFGTVCLLFGYRMPIGKQFAHKLPIFPPHVNKKRLAFVVVLYLVVGIASYALYIKSFGGITFSLNELTLKRRSSFQFLRAGSWLIYVAVYLGFIYYVKIRRKLIWWLMLAGALLIPLINQARKELLAVLLVLVVGYHHLVRRISFLYSLVIVALLMAISLAMLSQRNLEEFTVEKLAAGFEFNTMIEKNIGGRSFADITTMAHIVRHVDTEGDLRMGKTVLNFFAYYVPRVIWPNKPEHIGNEISELFYDEALGRSGMAGVPPSPVAELFWNFHLPGVVLGMLLFGIFLRISYEYIKRSPANPWTVMVYGITLIYIFEQSGGEIASSVFRYLQLLLPMLIAALFISQRSVSSTKSVDRTTPAQMVTPKQNILTSPRGVTKV